MDNFLILTHNRPLLFRRAINSVLSTAAHHDVEILVNNDTTDITEIYDPQINIRYFYHQSCDLADLYKLLYDEATGDYIYHLEDDDYILPTFFTNISFNYDITFLEYVSLPHVADVGIIAALRDKYRCGVYIKNINFGAVGSGMTRTVLPRRLNAGITYLPISDLSTSISMERLLGDSDIQIKGGLQYSLNSMINLMMGVQANPNRFGIGAKFKFINQTLTFGLLTHPVLPITHQLSLDLSF